MRAVLSLFLPVVLVFSGIPIQAQSAPEAPQRDAQALTVLTQALAAAGENFSVGSVADFTATGSITYYWAGQPVSGPVTVRGMRLNDIRVDATLPDGIRSWGVLHGKGSVKDAAGNLSTIPPHNTLNLGAFSFPLLKIAAALSNSALSVQYLGTTDFNGIQANVIHVAKNQSTDPGGLIAHLTAVDFLIDPTSYQILAVRDVIHPEDRATQDIAREIAFSDYRLANGILLPFSVTEQVNGQRTWTMQLDQIQVNSGLSDSDLTIL